MGSFNSVQARYGANIVIVKCETELRSPLAIFIALYTTLAMKGVIESAQTKLRVPLEHRAIVDPNGMCVCVIESRLRADAH